MNSYLERYAYAHPGLQNKETTSLGSPYTLMRVEASRDRCLLQLYTMSMTYSVVSAWAPALNINLATISSYLEHMAYAHPGL